MLLLHKRTTLLLVALAGAAILVACGGGGGGGSTPAAPATYTVGGTVSGLTVSGLVLQTSSGAEVSVSADGAFSFPSQVQNNTAYTVSVKTQPSSAGQSQTCSVTNGSGSVSGGNVTNIAVSCVTTACPQLSQPPAASAVSAIVAYDFVSSSTAPNNQFDVKYKVRFQNTEPGLKSVGATASATSGTSVVEGAVAFGDVGIYSTVVSSDDITLRQSVACATAAPALTWNVSSTVDAASQAGLLQGSSDQLALNSITSIDTEDELATDDILVRPEAHDISLSHIDVRLKRAATVGAANSALRKVQGKIISSVKGSLWLVIRIPRQADVTQLESAIAQLRNEYAIASAEVSSVTPPMNSLPSNYPSPEWLTDLLAIRAPAAWNAVGAQRAASDRPQFLVSDTFGVPTLGNAIAATIVGDALRGTASLPGAFSHGIAVVGKLAADYEFTPGNVPAATLLSSVTPVKRSEPVSMRVIEMLSPSGKSKRVFAYAMHKHVREMLDAGPAKRFVLNTSWGYCDRVAARCEIVAPAKSEAEQWIELVRDAQFADGSQANLVNRFLLVSAAGNDSGNHAQFNSGFTAAALTQGLQGREGGSLENLANTLVVENRSVMDYQVGSVPQAECLAASSTNGGNVSAIGSGGLMPGGSRGIAFMRNELGEVRIADGGTSMASPQAASLAYYMWSIRPDLGPIQLRNRIIGSSRTMAIVCARVAAPVIDAYGALVIDETVIASATPFAPVRRAILDFNSDGAFTNADVAQFASAFTAAQSGAPPDYGRADLNGDGHTSGTRVAAFNLNANRNASEAPIIDASVPVLVAPTFGSIDPMNEGSVSDRDILCWYIYSPLYTGDDDRSLADATLRANGQPGCVQRQSSNFVTWEYTLTVTSTNQLALNPTFFSRQPQAGETYTVLQVFDPQAPDSDTRAIFGRYVGANKSFTLRFANMPDIVLNAADFPIANPTNNRIAINDSSTANTDEYLASLEGSGTARTLRIRLYGTPPTTFASDALPLVPPNPNLFTIERSLYFAVLGSVVEGRIESIVVR